MAPQIPDEMKILKGRKLNRYGKTFHMWMTGTGEAREFACGRANPGIVVEEGHQLAGVKAKQQDCQAS